MIINSTSFGALAVWIMDGNQHVMTVNDDNLLPGVADGSSNWIKYRSLRPGQTNWMAAQPVLARPGSGELYSTSYESLEQLRRSNSAHQDDWFLTLSFPRVAINRNNGRIYWVYGDVPYVGSPTDRSDIFANEGDPETS